jgi:hypothetical protein
LYRSLLAAEILPNQPKKTKQIKIPNPSKINPHTYKKRRAPKKQKK